MEPFNFTSHKDFDVLKLQGDLKINVLSTLSPLLGEHIAKHPHQHLVIDFSSVTAIDGTITKLFTNIQKRMETNRRRMYLLQTPEAVAAELKSAHCNNTLSTLNELERGLNDDINQALLPYTCGDENGLKRLRCGCAVCGSKNVTGYLLDQNAFSWSWKDDAWFPQCSDRSGKEFEFFAAQPIVCLDCFLVSIDSSYFDILDANGDIARHSMLSDPARNHLAKNTHKRKSIFNDCADAPVETIFLHPRTRTSSYCAYLLADATIRVIAVNKAEATPFLAGVVNYRAMKYATEGQKDQLIDNCRTWVSQALKEQRIAEHSDRAQAYFILFIAALSHNKAKDANAIVQDFSAMMETVSYPKQSDSSINSPYFWFTRTQHLWQLEFEKKSQSLARAIEEKKESMR